MQKHIAIARAARNFITVDDEVHSSPSNEDCAIIVERAERYTEARKKLLLLIKPIEETANNQIKLT